MEVLNKRERVNSFIIFLLIFGLTMTIIITAIFYDYYVPEQELAQLREENFNLQREFEFQKKFATKLEEVKKYTDSIGVPSQDVFYNEQLAKNAIIDLRRMVPTGDTIVNNNMYDNIILTYKELVDAKRVIAESGGGQEQVQNLLSQIESYQEEIERIRRDLEICQSIERK